MTLFSSESIWLIALGKSILHSVWIGLLLLGLLKMILMHIPHAASSLRYRISVCTLLVLALSSVVLFVFFYHAEALIKQLPLPEETSPMRTLRDVVSHGKEGGLKRGLIFTICGYIYLVGMLFMVLRMTSSLFHTRSLRNSGMMAGAKWQEYLSGLSTGLPIRRKVYLLESYLVSGPVLVGYLKPAVIVPVGMLSNLPLSQLETILCHELYHLKRNDFLLNLMQLLLESLLFYNPGVWIISAIIRNERELCCDNSVIHSTGSPVNYAKALVHLAEHQQNQQQSRMATGAAGNSRHQLLSRISRILNTKTMKTNMREKLIPLLLVAGSLLLLMIVSGFSARPFIDKQDHPVPEPAGLVVTAFPAIMDTIPAPAQEASEAEELENSEEAEECDKIVDIDWEQLKVEIDEEMEAVRKEMEAIDWEDMKADMEKDFESIRMEMEDIDWEQVKKDMEESVSEIEIDMEKIKAEIDASMKDIDWDQIKMDMEKALNQLDSLRIDLDL